MTRSSLKLAVAATLLVSPCLGGCAVAVIGGLAAAGGVGYEAAQERGVNGTYSDMNLTSEVNNALNNQYGNITTTVYAGKVLLTGSSPSPQAKNQALQVASGIPGVARVYDEIQIAPTEDPGGLAQDTWITAQVRSGLMFDPDIRSGNYTIETDHQSVYLMGSARSQAELDKATQHARYVPGVQRVVSYVDIRYGEPNGQPPATAQAMPPPSYGAPPGGPGPAPAGAPGYNAPIQVQKL
ncbi:MAG TPA: BON domain-containing protein [Stellaceae bacterium]|nr:BON domain-containing protein [Stellaceae bacterium]